MNIKNNECYICLVEVKLNVIKVKVGLWIKREEEDWVIVRSIYIEHWELKGGRWKGMHALDVDGSFVKMIEIGSEFLWYVMSKYNKSSEWIVATYTQLHSILFPSLTLFFPLLLPKFSLSFLSFFSWTWRWRALAAEICIYLICI